MNKQIKIGLLVFLFVSICACDLSSLSGQSNIDQPRTYYDSLDLSSPEDAVMTFSEAFHRDDFMTVYLVLAPRSQFIIHQRINLLDYGYLFSLKYKEKVLEDVLVFSEGLGQGEHIDMGWYLFDQIMLSAKENSALLIDLSREVKITDSKKSETNDDDDAVDVITTVDGLDEVVIFRMVQAPSGNWRVYQVIATGGDEDMIPWSVPQTDD
jgi:hypothetical protein